MSPLWKSITQQRSNLWAGGAEIKGKLAKRERRHAHAWTLGRLPERLTGNRTVRKSSRGRGPEIVVRGLLLGSCPSL